MKPCSSEKAVSGAIIVDLTDDKQKRMLVFILTAIMQVAFLSGQHSKEILGYDLYRKEERDLFIDTVAEMLFSGICRRKGEAVV